MLRRLKAGFAVIGDVQFLPGYCVLITDNTGVDRRSDLPRPERLQFLAEMERLGETVQNVCAQRDPEFRRVNLEIQGNYDASACPRLASLRVGGAGSHLAPGCSSSNRQLAQSSPGHHPGAAAR